MFRNIVLCLLLLFTIILNGQVGIGTTTPDASAVLDIQSSANDKGILIPRVTQAQRNAISSPATGLMIFQTDGNVGFYFYDGSSWESFGEVKSVNGNSPAANGNVTLTFLATQTGSQAVRAATASPTDGLVHIVTGDPTPGENDKVYIYSTGLATWTLSSGFTDTDEQDISGSSFTAATSALVIDIEDGSGQTLDLSALEEVVTDTDPATNLTLASEGDLAYDTTDDELQAFDGTNWTAVFSGVVTPTLDQVTAVGSSTTNGIDVGSLTVNAAFTLPTATGTAGQYLTVSTTTSELVFVSPAAVVTPTLDQVTDVGSTTTNSIEVGGATVTGNLTVSVTTALNGNTTVGNATTDDVTITARLDSDLIPKTDNSRNLGSSSLNFDTVNTLNVTSNAAMTVSSTGILTLNTSATGTPTISLQQGGTEMAGIGSSTFFIGDSSSGNQYFFPQETGTAGQYLTVSTTTSELVFVSPAAVVTPTLDQVTDVGSTTTNSIEVGGATVTGNLTVSVTTALNGNTTVGNATTDDVTITARLDSDLIPKTDNSRNLGSSSLNFDTVNTLNVTSNAAMTVSSTGILTLNTSATGTPTISLQQGGTEMAGIGSSTFFIGDSSSGTHYFFPTQWNVSSIPGYDNTKTSVLGLNPTVTPNEVAFINADDLISLTISETTQLDNRTPNGITVTANSFVVSGTSASVYGNFDAQGSASESITIDLGRGAGDDRISIEAYLDTSIEIAPEETNLAIGSASYTLQNIYARFVDSGNNDLSLNSQVTNGDIIFTIDGNTVAGVDSSTLYIGNGSTEYRFPEISTLPATPNNQVLAYTSTSTLSFLSGAALPSGTAEGQTLRYNASDGEWEVSDLLKINPGGTFANNITVSNTLVPYTNKSFDLGKTSYEFDRVYANRLTTANSSMTLTTNGNTAVFKLAGWSTYGAIYLNSQNEVQADTANTIIGADSFTSTNTLSRYNTVLGFKNIPKSGFIGDYNIAVGTNNLNKITSGDGNIAIGEEVLKENTGNSDLIGIGRRALQNTNANYNIGIGYEAAQKNSSGDANIAIGYQALKDGTTFSNNIAIGFRALGSNSSSGNIGIGYQALNSTNSGGQNIAIGYDADITSPSVANSIALGSNASVSTSNTIQLGNSNITQVNTSGVVSATGYKTTGTATITTLTVGDTSKYTMPTTRGTAGQVLTVSTTTSQLVFADASSSPNYFLAQTATVTKWNIGSDLELASPSISNGISLTGLGSNTISLPSGKVYKATAYILINPGTGFSGLEEFSFGFHDGSNSIGAAGTYYQFPSTPDNFSTVPAVAIIDATSVSVNLSLQAISISSGEAGVYSTSYVVVEEL